MRKLSLASPRAITAAFFYVKMAEWLWKVIRLSPPELKFVLRLHIEGSGGAIITANWLSPTLNLPKQRWLITVPILSPLNNECG